MSDHSRAKDQPRVAGAGVDPHLLAGIEVRLEAFLGAAEMTVAELLALKTGDDVALDANLARDVELRLNGKAIGRGELVAIDDQYAVRILEIARSAS